MYIVQPQDRELSAVLGQTGSGSCARHFRSRPRGWTQRHPVRKFINVVISAPDHAAERSAIQ